MARHALTDQSVKALKSAPKGKRRFKADKEPGGFGVRVTDTGAKSFVLIARYPDADGKAARNPTRRAIGDTSEMSVTKARETAVQWLKWIRAGKDPRDEIKRQRQADARKRANTFAAVAEDFIADKLKSERRGAECEADIRRELMDVWGAKPITDIADTDILAIIQQKKRKAPVAARNLLALIKRLFGWAVDQRCYGLTLSPAATLKGSKIIGTKSPRYRVLNDSELFALWRAAGRVGYPHGTAVRLLILTGLRLNEAADADWRELDIHNSAWTIPAARMKGRDGLARAHVVPLTADILALVEPLPRWKGGDHLFSTNSGKTPVWLSNKVRNAIHKRMLRTLRALARRRGEDPENVELPRWTYHDIRRTVRTGLSRIKIAEEIREAVLAHARPGIKGTYDIHDYFDEKREALELWAGRLRTIVEPPPVNVVDFKRAG